VAIGHVAGVEEDSIGIQIPIICIPILAPKMITEEVEEGGLVVIFGAGVVGVVVQEHHNMILVVLRILSQKNVMHVKGTI
jgi:hypothetical protein